MSTRQRFEERLYKLNDDFSLFTAKKYPATEDMLADFERQQSLPAEYKEFLLSYGMLILEVKESVWERPEEFDTLPAWKFGYATFTMGLSPNDTVPEWMLLKKPGKHGLLFFERSGGLYSAYFHGDKIAIDHDNEGSDGPDWEEFNGNFWDFLINEIDKLENDYKNYITEAE